MKRLTIVFLAMCAVVALSLEPAFALSNIGKGVVEVEFAEEDIPLFIPFGGNSYVKSPIEERFLDYMTGEFKEPWSDAAHCVSSYFRVGGAGELNIAVVARGEGGSGDVRFTIDGEEYDLTISGEEERVYSLTTIDVAEAGYIQIDMQGVARSGESFGRVVGYRVGGSATDAEMHYVTREELAKEPNGAYFIMRGPSTHWKYEQPVGGDVEYFYNEVVVNEEDAIKGSYYMLCGFSSGYMGIQRGTTGGHRVLFSIWSPYVTDDPSAIPSDYEVVALRSGEGVVVKEFGGEGSGGQSFWDYEWKVGESYSCMVSAEPDGEGNTIFTGYFYAEGEWHLIASFRRPKTNTYVKGIYSFLESFDPSTTIYPRKVRFNNQWARMTTGEWREITNARFSCDATANAGHRYDYCGYVDEETNSFVLKGFGFFKENTAPAITFTRQPNGTAPEIDFEKLKLLGL